MLENKRKNENSQVKIQKYLCLQKKIQNAEADRKAFAEETIAVVKKQRTKVDFLKQESKALKDRLASLFEKNFMKNDFLANKKEIDQKSLIEKYKKELEEENAKLKTINTNIKIFKKQIINQKRNIGGVNVGSESQHLLQK